jgi:hypothetical protein
MVLPERRIILVILGSNYHNTMAGSQLLDQPSNQKKLEKNTLFSHFENATPSRACEESKVAIELAQYGI